MKAFPSYVCTATRLSFHPAPQLSVENFANRTLCYAILCCETAGGDRRTRLSNRPHCVLSELFCSDFVKCARLSRVAYVRRVSHVFQVAQPIVCLVQVNMVH